MMMRRRKDAWWCVPVEPARRLTTGDKIDYRGGALAVRGLPGSGGVCVRVRG
jgi:hypothetical protein